MKHTKGARPYPYLQYAVLFLLPFFVYLRVATFDFTYHDDDTMIIDGAAKLANYSVKDFLATDAWLRKAEIELYRPWQGMSYAIDYRLAKTNPAAYHLHNLLIFCLSIILLFEFLKKLRFDGNVAFGLALLYSVHYLMAHVVSWIPARGDVYLVLFGLASILSFYNWQEQQKWFWLALSAVAYFFALLTKESGITLLAGLVALAVYERWIDFKRINSFNWLIPFVVLTMIYFQLRSGSVIHSDFIGISAMIYNLPTIPEELFKFFIPISFSVMPGFKPYMTAGGIVLFVLLGASVYLLRNKINLTRVAIGAAFFLLTIGPSVFYKPVFASYAYDYLDHRMFMCGIGLLIVCGEFFLLLKRWNEKGALAFYFILLAASASLAFYYSGTYKDFNHYYTNAVTTNPKSGFAIYNLSSVLASKEKKYDEALVLIEKAVEMYPGEFMYQKGKAGIAYQKGDFELMRKTALTLVEKWPENNFGYSFQGMYEFNAGKYDAALTYFSKAISLNNKDYDSFGNRAKILQASGKLDEALNDWSHAISGNPQFAEAYFERGSIYGQKGNVLNAVKDYNAYVSLRPDDARGYFYRGQAQCLLGNNKKGCEDLNIAKELNLADDSQIIQMIQQYCAHL